MSGNGVPKRYGTSIRCCRNLKTVLRRFKPGIPQSMPQGRQLLAASTAAKGSGLRRRDSTRQLALRLALVPRPSPVRHRRLAACRRRCPRRRSPAHGRGAQAAIVLLAMAQQETRLALAHSLLDHGASALPARQRLPWSSTPSVRPPSGS